VTWLEIMLGGHAGEGQPAICRERSGHQRDPLSANLQQVTFTCRQRHVA
jgi:hypothetical protein